MEKNQEGKKALEIKVRASFFTVEKATSNI